MDKLLISLHKATKIMEVDTEMFWQVLELMWINVSCSGYPYREINYQLTMIINTLAKIRALMIFGKNGKNKHT